MIKVNIEKKFQVESDIAKFRALNQNSHFRVYDLKMESDRPLFTL